MFCYLYWKRRIFTQFKCALSVKIHNFHLRHWFDLKSNCILWNNYCNFNAFDFVVVFASWKWGFFLSTNLCRRCMWCFRKGDLYKRNSMCLSFPFTWTLLQLLIVWGFFPHTNEQSGFWQFFPQKENFKTEKQLCQEQSLFVQSQHRNNITWLMTHSSPAVQLRITITHQVCYKSSGYMLFQRHGYWINQRKSQLPC